MYQKVLLQYNVPLGLVLTFDTTEANSSWNPSKRIAWSVWCQYFDQVSALTQINLKLQHSEGRHQGPFSKRFFISKLGIYYLSIFSVTVRFYSHSKLAVYNNCVLFKIKLLRSRVSVGAPALGYSSMPSGTSQCPQLWHSRAAQCQRYWCLLLHGYFDQWCTPGDVNSWSRKPLQRSLIHVQLFCAITL